MQVFVHFKKQQLEKHIASLVQLNESYIKKSYELNENLTHTLEEIEAYFKQIGDSSNESKISKLRTHFDTALSGIDPLQLQKVKTGRRAMITTAAFYCLNELQEILHTDLKQVLEILKNAEEPISQVIITALQSSLITDKQMEDKNLETIAQLWEKLLHNEQVKMLDRRLKMDILTQDIHLLIDTIFEKIKN